MEQEPLRLGSICEQACARIPRMSLSATLRLAAGIAMGASGAAEEAIFESGGKKIGVEIFRPDVKQRVPALIVLHGASGAAVGNNYVRQLGVGFASAGYAAFLVRYFERTGTSYAGDATIYRHYQVWSDTIHDAVTFASADPLVDAKRVAVLGYSLGGYLAVTQGARDPRVAAVIEIAGGLDKESPGRAKRMPPTLILHGEADQRVLVSEARALEKWLKKIGATHDVHVYPTEGHLLSVPAALDALARGHAFLGKHLLTP